MPKTPEQRAAISESHKRNGIMPSDAARQKASERRNPKISSLGIPCKWEGCDRVSTRKVGLCDRCYQRQKLLDDRETVRGHQLKHVYGITHEVYNNIMENQEGLCPICEQFLIDPCLDHCHITGKIRGIICRKCNTGIGMLMDNPSLLRRAAEYLENHGTVFDHDYSIVEPAF